MSIVPGKVFIVGAGPGDPGLITFKAIKKLKSADVVVYDRLINDELLSFCSKECEKIFVGKEAGYHPVEQERITEILINKSKSGLNVVRLKGGNPFIFGRGSEEALALKKAGIEFEIIPGITSGLSAPIYSGIPITQRGQVTQCIFITAHESPDKSWTQVDWNKLANLKNTSLIIYMGASKIELISKNLIKNGMDPSTPAAVIENATLPKQRTITASLDRISDEFKKQNFHAPVIIMISPTVSLRKEISWFEKKPLFNKRIVMVGAGEQSNELNEMLYDLGADVIQLPVMKFKIKIPEISFMELLSKNDFEWILFTSRNCVEYFFELLDKEKLDARVFGRKKIAAIGSGTIKALESHSLRPDYSSEEFIPSSLTNNYLEKYKLRGKKILRIKDDYPIDNMYAELTDFGAVVKAIEVFETIPDKPEPELIAEIQKNYPDILIFSSSSGIDYFFKVLDSKTALDIINNCDSIVLDPITPESLLKENTQSLKISSLTSRNIQDIVSKLT
jgi:uroporphyrinogen III methyltransferase/synthase